MIEVLTNGALNAVQDLGRPAAVRWGVSAGGVMDAPALKLANYLVGNDESEAGIEVTIFPMRLRFHRRSRFACTGATSALQLSDRVIPGWWSATAQAGDVLTIPPPTRGGRAYLTFEGGIDVPLVLGSRSTDIKGSFGGLEGRGLRKGDKLPLRARRRSRFERPLGIAPESRLQLAEELASGCVTVRAILAAEYMHFTEEARRAFEQSDYQLTPACNRQGYRLEGVPLRSNAPLDLLSHGVVPGTVQVPQDGQPIIQLAEANTCGGYPKIATVIDADVWRLAQMGPGHRVKFKLIDHHSALRAAQALEQEQARIRHGLTTLGLLPPSDHP